MADMKTRTEGNGPKRRARIAGARTNAAPREAPARDADGVRKHGDSYSDVLSREDDLGATASTHGKRADRRFEEPSEAAVDEPVRDG